MAWTRKRSKYGAKKVTVDGITFDSKKEKDRYIELKLLEKAGKISDLQLQVKYTLIPPQYEPTGEVYTRGKKKGQPKMRLAERECSYLADFVYTENGKMVVEDTKSEATRTPVYMVKRKLMLYIHGIKIREV